MEIPHDLIRLLSLAVRDAVWYKTSIAALLRSCGVPSSILNKYSANKSAPTLQLLPDVVADLQALGPSGDLPLRRLFTQMCNWKDFNSLDPDKQMQAKSSVVALRSAHQTYLAEIAFHERQVHEEYERKSQEARKVRVSVGEVDHARLQRMRDDFDRIYPLADETERGREFETLMNELFGYYATISKGGLRRAGEQIDGHFYLDNHQYYAEIRWKKKRATAGEISVLRDRATAGFGGDTRAVFVSFDGFSPEALERLAGRAGERVILLDGTDIHAVLDGRIGLDVLLMEKQMDLGQGSRAFVGVYELLQMMGTRS